MQCLVNLDLPLTIRLHLGDYARRAARGEYIRRPYVIGNDDYEAGLFKVIAVASNFTLPDLAWAIFNLASFTCPVSDAVLARSHFVPTYPYRYFGDFPKARLAISPSSGAWHGSEIGLIWRAEEAVSGEAATLAEKSISNYMSGAWATFAKNPQAGLSLAPYEWPSYNATANTLIRLADDNETAASYIDPATYDIACSVLEAVLTQIPGGFAGLATASPSVLASLGQFSNLTALGGGSEVGY